MAEVVDGKVVMKAPDGRLYRVAPEEVETVQRNLSWAPAGSEETAQRVAEREQYSRYGSTGQQALALGEQAVRTATFGLVPGTGTPEDIAGREAVVREQSPVLSVGAQAVGALAPALLTGGAATGIAGAAGLSARGAGIVGAVGEGLVGGLAEEVEQARFETRDVSVGNVMLFGLGGEIVGRALPKAMAMGAGRVKRALTAVDEAAGEGVADALAATEARSVATHAKLARDLPKGSPERLQALKRTAPEQYDRMATESAADLDELTQLTSKMGDTSSSKRVVERLRETISDESPAQVEFFTAAKARLAEAKRAIRNPIDAPVEDAAAGAPVSLAGKSLRDLGAIDAPDSLKQDTLEALRTGKGGRNDFAADFATTGRVREDGPFQGIQIEMGPKGPILRDGRNRLTVAREQGRETVYGQVYQGQRAPGKAPIYEGEIRIAPPSKRGRRVGTPEAQTAEELLATYPTREAREEAAEELREAIADRLEEYGAKNADEGSEQWATVEREIVRERVATLSGARRNELSGDLKTIAARFDQIVDTGLRRLDKTDDVAEQFLIARNIKKQLQHVSKKMSLMKSPQDEFMRDEMRDIIDDSWRDIRNGLNDKSLFGAAAEIESDINAAWHDKVLRGLGISEQDLARRVDVDFKTGRTIVEFDPAKSRGFYQQDSVARTITQRKLHDVLEGAEEMAAAHARHGTWDADEVAKLRSLVKRERERLSLADELQVAKRAETPEAPKPKRGIMSHLGEIAVEEVVDKVPFGGLAMRAGRKLLRSEAGKEASSAGAQRVRDIMARRKGQSGGVDVGRAPSAEPQLLTEVRQKLANWDKQEAAYREALARKDALDIEMNRAGIRRMEAETESARKAAAKEERALRAKIDKLDDELEDLSSNRTEKWDSNWDEPLEQLRHAMEEAGDPRAAKLAELEDLGDASAVRAAMDDLDRGGRVGDVIARRRGQGGAVLFEDEDTFERVLRRDPNTPELKDRFAEADDSGITKRLSEEDLEKMVGVGVLPHEGWPEVTSTQNWVRVRVEDPFEFDRWIVREPNGELVARHAVLRLPSDLRGAGVAKRYLADAVETYEKLGIKEIQIPKATEDGVVVWFKLGAVESPGGLILKTAKESGFEVESLEQLAKTRRGQSFLMDLEQKEPGMFGDFILDVANLKSRLGRMSPDQLVSQAGNVRAGPGIRGVLTSPIGVTSGVGALALGAPVAYNQLRDRGDSDEFGLGAIVDAASPRAGNFRAAAAQLLGIDRAGRDATKQAARVLAGVSVIESAPPQTPLARFTADYSGPEESFEAKRKILDADLSQPEVLFEVLGSTMGDLPKVNPELFQDIAARTAAKIQYLRENMPAGIAVSLLYPNGTPPSRSAIREWAEMWNTAMDPESVLEDINAGTATPLQMKTLRETDPDLYEQLRQDVIEQVGANFRDVPTSTKLRLDMYFDADGMPGPMFSSAAARMIGDAMKEQAARAPKGVRAGAAAGEALDASNPAGIENIKSSVTNAGAS